MPCGRGRSSFSSSRSLRSHGGTGDQFSHLQIIPFLAVLAIGVANGLIDPANAAICTDEEHLAALAAPPLPTLR
jgi:hypothetical protein